MSLAHNLSQKITALGCAILVLAGAAFVYRNELKRLFHRETAGQLHSITFRKNADGSTSPEDTLAEIAYWRARIHTIGSGAAHTEFVTSANSFAVSTEERSQGTQILHHAAHTFGEALYQEVGLAGAAVCGQEFGAGCLHSFFGLAIQEFGIGEGVKKLDMACTAETDALSREFCRHGIGHGILAYLGYSVEDLVHALRACHTVDTTEDDFRMGCGGGVFMEYNIRFLLRTDGTPQRELTEKNMYQPCDSVSPEYQYTCMFWQPTWWFGPSQPEDLLKSARRISAYCQAFPAAASVTRSCFEGIGYVLPQKTSDSALIAQSCAISDDLQNRYSCWRYALSRAPSNLQLSRSSALVCAGFSGAAHDSCRKKMSEALLNSPTATLSPQ